MSDGIGEPDLVLLVKKIEEDASNTSYSIEGNFDFWRNPNCRTLCSELGTLVITGSNRHGTDELVLALEATHHVRAHNSDPEARTAAVRELGKNLWDMLPSEFQDYYWKHLHGKELSILVLTDDLRFPWELIWPHREAHAEEWHHIFGVAFSMARWPREHEPLPGSIASSGEFLIVIPGSNDDCGKSELNYMINSFNAKNVFPSTFENLKSNLAQGPVRVLHIRTHGAFVSGGHSIQLAGGELFDRTRVPELMSENLGGSLVFLNVCEAGLRTPGQPFHVAGWGGAFASVGCSAIISPYWEVSQGVAASVVRWFYDQLQHGATVGEAMRAVRRSFATVDTSTPAVPGSEPADCYGSCGFAPTCLGYTVVGHPNARMTSFGAGRTGPRSLVKHRQLRRFPTPWEPLRG